MAPTVKSEIRDSVAIATLDDGKANAVSRAVVDDLCEHLARAEKDAKAVLITGREGLFSGGFDLSVMGSGVAQDVYDLVNGGAELYCRIRELPIPVVVAASGHAIAAGAIFLLAADARIGAEGAFRIGLNEVGAGMTLPRFARELARDRLSKRHLIRAVGQAEIYDPPGAVGAGFLDRLVPPGDLADAAFAEAQRLGGLPQPAFGNTKRALHAELVAMIRKTSPPDLRAMMGLEG